MDGVMLSNGWTIPQRGNTASCYRNERDIGNSLKDLLGKHGITRKEIFLTSKVAPKDMTHEKARLSCLQTVEDLQCGYLDLLLIHWPGKAKLQPDNPKHALYRKEVWLSLEQLQREGLVRNIGVSNYTLKHLQELLQYANIKPAVLQVEFHPHLIQEDLLKFCREHNIFFQAYSSLGTGELISNEVVKSISEKYGRTSSQILLRWAVQQKVGVIPKSTNPRHIQSNFAIADFKIEEEDMETIRSLNFDKHYCWDPNTIT